MDHSAVQEEEFASRKHNIACDAMAGASDGSMGDEGMQDAD